eukprot:9490692-Pyramimonas_sp.AAC.1
MCLPGSPGYLHHLLGARLAVVDPALDVVLRRWASVARVLAQPSEIALQLCVPGAVRLVGKAEQVEERLAAKWGH